MITLLASWSKFAVNMELWAAVGIFIIAIIGIIYKFVTGEWSFEEFMGK